MEPNIKRRYYSNKIFCVGRWCLQYIIAPLFTVFFAGVIAYFSGLNKYINFDLINPTLLSFVMVLIIFSVIMQVENLAKKDNTHSIYLISFFGLGTFFVTFTLSALYSNFNAIDFNNLVDLLNSNTQNSIIILQNNAFDKFQFLNQNVNSNLTIINQLRAGVLLFSGLTIITLVAFRCVCDDLEGCKNGE